MTKKEKAEAKAHALEMLHKFVQPGDTIYTIVTHVSKSGMSRDIKMYTIKDNEPVYLSGYVARALDLRLSNDGVRVGGCGMDMGYHLVMNLSYALHGYEDKNVPEERKGRPFSPSKDAYRAGYSLNHRLL
jgi:hypothetical protein